ncbi:MAG: TIGR04283 family arsenosugar biosynthesis glycosyltransferase [Xanthobacteraceae bacterium]
MNARLGTAQNIAGVTIVSVIVPVLNEAATIGGLLRALAPARARGVEVIVADGGSTDNTCATARHLCSHVVSAPRGRGAQMNAGAAIAGGDVFLFVHADTRLPGNFDRLIIDGLAHSNRAWGRFDVRIWGRHPLLPLVALMMNLRSRLTGIATGDQAMFVTREAFSAVGGFPDVALMEDVIISRRLIRLTRPLCLSTRVTTSGRRWDQRGFFRTVMLMWRLRLSLFFGASPDALARTYGYTPRPH